MVFCRRRFPLAGLQFYGTAGAGEISRNVRSVLRDERRCERGRGVEVRWRDRSDCGSTTGCSRCREHRCISHPQKILRGAQSEILVASSQYPVASREETLETGNWLLATRSPSYRRRQAELAQAGRERERRISSTFPPSPARAAGPVSWSSAASRTAPYLGIGTVGSIVTTYSTFCWQTARWTCKLEAGGLLLEGGILGCGPAGLQLAHHFLEHRGLIRLDTGPATGRRAS